MCIYDIYIYFFFNKKCATSQMSLSLTSPLLKFICVVCRDLHRSATLDWRNTLLTWYRFLLIFCFVSILINTDGDRSINCGWLGFQSDC